MLVSNMAIFSFDRVLFNFIVYAYTATHCCTELYLPSIPLTIVLIRMYCPLRTFRRHDLFVFGITHSLYIKEEQATIEIHKSDRRRIHSVIVILCFILAGRSYMVYNLFKGYTRTVQGRDQIIKSKCKPAEENA